MTRLAASARHRRSAAPTLASLALTPDAQRRRMTSGDAVASIGRWARELTAHQQSIARETFDDLLAELGYDP